MPIFNPGDLYRSMSNRISGHIPELNLGELYKKISGNLYDISVIVAPAVAGVGVVVMTLGTSYDKSMMSAYGGTATGLGFAYLVASVAAKHHYRSQHNSSSPNDIPPTGLENETAPPSTESRSLETLAD